jgi:hypothetical protein
VPLSAAVVEVPVVHVVDEDDDDELELDDVVSGVPVVPMELSDVTSSSSGNVSAVVSMPVSGSTDVEPVDDSRVEVPTTVSPTVVTPAVPSVAFEPAEASSLVLPRVPPVSSASVPPLPVLEPSLSTDRRGAKQATHTHASAQRGRTR